MPETGVRRRTSTGTCAFCEGAFSKGSMTQHLAQCPVRQTKTAAADAGSTLAYSIYHLVVEGKHAKDYWLHLELPGSATFQVLDTFLRRVWLECCGHLSQFSIPAPVQRGMYRQSQKVTMGKRLEQVLTQDVALDYEYDFGSTTHLTVKFVGKRKGLPVEPGVVLMARNHAPEILCSGCGQPATQITGDWDATAWCDECAENKDEDYLLPVVNSPRCGVCGYTG